MSSTHFDTFFTITATPPNPMVNVTAIACASPDSLVPLHVHLPELPIYQV